MGSGVALGVFAALFAFVTILGFVASRWRKGDLSQLHEWGLGGRRFGSVIVWFLLGGDLYTAYTFIAVPALMFGVGAPGFFAVPYTILVYPIMFAVFPRLWSVAHAKGYVTAADFVRGRFGIGRARAWRSRSPASSRPCPTSRCSLSASRWCSRRSASMVSGRCSSPLWCSPPTPIRAACARRR